MNSNEIRSLKLMRNVYNMFKIRKTLTFGILPPRLQEEILDVFNFTGLQENNTN